MKVFCLYNDTMKKYVGVAKQAEYVVNIGWCDTITLCNKSKKVLCDTNEVGLVKRKDDLIKYHDQISQSIISEISTRAKTLGLNDYKLDEWRKKSGYRYYNMSLVETRNRVQTEHDDFSARLNEYNKAIEACKDTIITTMDYRFDFYTYSIEPKLMDSSTNKCYLCGYKLPPFCQIIKIRNQMYMCPACIEHIHHVSKDELEKNKEYYEEKSKHSFVRKI